MVHTRGSKGDFSSSKSEERKNVKKMVHYGNEDVSENEDASLIIVPKASTSSLCIKNQVKKLESDSSDNEINNEVESDDYSLFLPRRQKQDSWLSVRKSGNSSLDLSMKTESLKRCNRSESESDAHQSPIHHLRNRQRLSSGARFKASPVHRSGTQRGIFYSTDELSTSPKRGKESYQSEPYSKGTTLMSMRSGGKEQLLMDDEPETVEEGPRRSSRRSTSIYRKEASVHLSAAEESHCEDVSAVEQLEHRQTRRKMKGSSDEKKIKNFTDDMYSKVKRERRPVNRLSYGARQEEAPGSSSTSSEEEEEEEEEEQSNGVEEVGSRRRYSLRRNRREFRPFQLEDNATNNGYNAPPRRSLRHDDRNRKHFLPSPARKTIYSDFNHKRRAAHNSTSTSSSSDDDNYFEKRKAKSMNKSRSRCLPMNFQKDDLIGVVKDRTKIGSSLADIDPMTVDRNVNFDSVGGLTHHVKSLKEMVVFPLLYPEVFEKFVISPPRGVLFYGPPGTGKTLVARALANECSLGDKKVAFFMRKGADCLSKWVGESERQLRLLFDQAYQMRPSIIFFDEIDGLAPVRSSRQDQIHSSIVSTLLALMDGLDSRGEVVVIGATNRIDAIDPALRRPGRFDREFLFGLPNVKSRKQILGIHTRQWQPLPSPRLLSHLAEQTVGFCGADLKSLVSEAALVALRWRFPQIYSSSQKLVLDMSKIQIKLRHFRSAMAKIVPAGQRSLTSVGRKLSCIIEPLLKSSLQKCLQILAIQFPQSRLKLSSASANCQTHRPRLLIHGTSGQGQSSHLAPAIVHALEKFPAHKLDLPALYSVSARAPEEACAQVFQDARRDLPSIIYVPHIDQWWSATSDTLRATFMALLQDLDPSMPLLLLATTSMPFQELDEEIRDLFSKFEKEVVAMTNPDSAERRSFFRPLFYTTMVQKPKIRQAYKRIYEELPVAAPVAPRQLSVKELSRLEEVEESSLRELRIFLRQILTKLSRNRMFYIFSKPVDAEDIPDYIEIIKEPMDLDTMMTKIDKHQYDCAEDFLKDIDLICANALEYNPAINPEDKLIRHRACTLRDTAYAYIKAEMDTDFEEKCKEVRKSRQLRHLSPSKCAPAFVNIASRKNLKDSIERISQVEKKGSFSSDMSKLSPSSPGKLGNKLSDRKRRKRSSWSLGIVPKVNKRRRLISDDDAVKPIAPEEEDKQAVSSEGPSTSQGTNINGANSGTEDSRDSTRVTTSVGVTMVMKTKTDEKISLSAADDSMVSSSEQGHDTVELVWVDYDVLEKTFEACVEMTENRELEDIHRLYSVISQLCFKHRMNGDKSTLLQEVKVEILRFKSMD